MRIGWHDRLDSRCREGSGGEVTGAGVVVGVEWLLICVMAVLLLFVWGCIRVCAHVFVLFSIGYV